MALSSLRTPRKDFQSYLIALIFHLLPSRTPADRSWKYFMGLSNPFAHQPESYAKKKQYKFEEDLGDGAFSTVRQATWKPPKGSPHFERASKAGGIEVAVKVISKKKLHGDFAPVHEEIEVLKGLDHPNMIKLLDWFESKDKYYLVFELASGGDLFARIWSDGKFTEADAASIIIDILEAVKYLHGHNIVHRDLKPENLLYARDGADTVMLADFGIAKRLAPGEKLTVPAGSPGYAAPEILLQKEHDLPCDIWSVGIIAYLLLCGYLPFKAQETNDLIRQCTRAAVRFETEYWEKISDDAKAFCMALIQPDPAKRPTADQALKHKWLVEADAEKHKHDLSAHHKGRWQRSVNSVIAASRLTQGGTRHAATRESSLAPSPEPSTSSTPAPRASTSTDGGDEEESGFHTAEEEDAEDARHAAVRKNELETKRLERERGEGEGMRKYVDSIEIDDASKRVEKLAV
ncbi:serine/threonine-protein kinase [Sporobolomyces salmoneus]|uniref:serine/threonine-protein kinase n=1 Tax=Sporobolomyces salmoneus TaxID=183962 RepID=UPI0031828F05